MHFPTLFQLLARAVDQIDTEFSLNEKVVQTIENNYHYASERVAFFSYCLEWSEHISTAKQAVPNEHLNAEKEKLGMLLTFHNLREPDLTSIERLNNRFSIWINDSVLRGLDEYFQFYLLNLFDICSTISLSSKSIKVSQIYAGIEKEQEFERASLKERLALLSDQFSVQTKYQRELVTLNKLRHIIAHHDGKVRESDFNNNQYFEVLWFGHTVHLKNEVKNKKIPAHRVSAPASSNAYNQAETSFFTKQRLKKFQLGERISFSAQEVKEICSFYILILDSLQESLCSLAKSNNWPVKDFNDYRIKCDFSVLVEED